MSVVEFEPAARLLAGIIRGTVTAWPSDAVETGVRATAHDLVEAAEAHGVAPLIWRAIDRSTDRTGAWPPDFVAGIRERARAEAALSIARQAELARVCVALEAAGLPAVVIKGAHLAASVYETSDLRPRGDTDVLIDEGDRSRARTVLGQLGYVSVPHVTGDLIRPQFSVRRDDPVGPTHHLDIHWRLAMPHAFAGLPAFDDVWTHGSPIAASGRWTRMPSLAHALVVACAHRAAHHAEPGALIWIVDVHRIVERLTDDGVAFFVTAVDRARVRAVAGRALALARDLFGAPLAPALAALADARPDRSELTAAYLAPRRKVDDLALDLRALDGWRARVRLLRQHLLPSPAYMLAAYGAPRALLPWLYLRRAVGGAVRWFSS